MLNHAFLITAHAFPDQLKEILSALSAPNHYFFINIDKKSKWGQNFIESAKNSHNLFLEGNERIDVSHGGFSQIAATLCLLNKAYSKVCVGGGRIDYFHLISGQDFPIWSNRKFDSFFKQNEGKSYMLYDSEENHQKWIVNKYPFRIRPYWFIDLPHGNNPIVKFIKNRLNSVSKHLWIRRMIPGVRAGWNWFSWHRTVAEFIIRQEKENPFFFKRFHYTFCADEVIFHTLLYPHVKELNIETTNCLRYVNWQKKDIKRANINSPLQLNEEEYEDIINSGALFCRKIHPVISAKLKHLLKENAERN